MSFEGSRGESTFWDVDGFRPVVKRVDQGATLLDDMSTLITERAAIEARYVTALQQWNHRWEQRIEQSTKYRESKSNYLLFKGPLVEAAGVAVAHALLQQRLLNEVKVLIDQWKRDHYTTSMMRIKEVKQIEDEFMLAQKPWRKSRTKADKYRKEYHHRAMELDQLNSKLQMVLSTNPPLITDEDMAKLRVKIADAQRGLNLSLQKYKDRLQMIEDDKQRYQREMIICFNKTQEMELDRIRFMQTVLEQYQKAVHLEYGDKDEALLRTLQSINPEPDLIEYAHRHGPGNGAIAAPRFVEATFPLTANRTFQTVATIPEVQVPPPVVEIQPMPQPTVPVLQEEIPEVVPQPLEVKVIPVQPPVPQANTA